MEVVPVNDKRSLNVDEIFSYIGEFGRFQKLLIIAVIITTLPASVHPIFMYFATLTPEWKCNENSSHCLLNGTFPGDDGRRCDIPRQEWHYMEKEEFSLVTEFNLDCEKKWILNLLTSSFFVGWGFGAIIIGRMADVYGRKKFIFVSAAIVMLIAFITPYMPNFYLIAVCRFVIGFFYPGCNIQCFIMMSEYVGNKERPVAACLISFAFATIWILLALEAYLLKDWKILSFVNSAPFIFVLGLSYFIPESIRWLQLNDRHDEAMEILYKIARVNKKDLPADVTLSIPREKGNYRSSLIDIFRIRKTAICTSVQCYLWLVIGLSFYGIHLAASDLEGSVYRDFVLLCLVEYPAGLVSIPLCKRFGRRISTLIPLFMTAVSCLIIGFIPEKGVLKIARITFGIIGKAVGYIAFHVLYIWSAELFPTEVRAAALGLLQVFSRIGSGSSPWVVNGMKQNGPWIPFTVMGIACLFGSGFGVLLPETKDTVLKESVQQNVNTIDYVIKEENKKEPREETENI